ncbi:zinc-binding dehydrogenase [Micropruina sonneratiae]|uniref:zinc-binding dehydrogenase n=1 Tax=Micropruina sonneratiae TaxID=2986940 RepID=UPI002227874F|nr:zinc-binding dehydrogenase [Micropruina sp. KQZ13P-5]MCW3159344.1 zinc-binding dehydrogenase [Micropruina sp. KQZ13P-5]
MRALVKYAPGPGHVELRSVERPSPGAGQLLVDVAYAGVCGTDRSALDGHFTGLIPRTLGHEASGVISAIGPGVVGDWSVGDRVTFETDAYLCGTCLYCRAEQYQRCPHRKGIGTTANGALADALVMPELAVHRLPDGVSLLAAALTEPLAICVHAVIERSPSLAGEVVIVTGPGAIGALTSAVAGQVGATTVLVGRTRHADRLADAVARGIADHALDGDAVDVEAYVKSLTDGYGAHTGFECSGANHWPRALQPMVRRGGRVVLVALYHGEVPVDFDLLVNREHEIVGSRGKNAQSYRTALRLMADKRIDAESFISDVLPLERWEDGLDLVAQGRKVVFEVGGA